MSPRLIGIASIALAALPLAGLLHWQISASAGPAGTTGHGTVGGAQTTLLLELTRIYLAETADASAGMKSGVELAPVDFLNEQLKSRGAKWRVRSTDGLDADTYDVS